jgi:hypothetical protein
VSARDRVAAILMRARRCNEAGGAAESGTLPCPFCFWSLDANEESGCYVWADEIIAAMAAGEPL